MSEIKIQTKREDNLIDFLNLKGFETRDLENQVYQVIRKGELPVYLHIDASNLYFEVDLGSLKGIGSEQLYYELLDLNTIINPVSLGIDSSNSDDPRLVLVESRETGDLSDQELLSVFDAMELAAEKIEPLLSKYIS